MIENEVNVAIPKLEKPNWLNQWVLAGLTSLYFTSESMVKLLLCCSTLINCVYNRL